MSESADIFDQLHRATSESAAYREVIRETAQGLPDWLVPFSFVDGPMLEWLADELAVSEGQTFVDLACGTGGSGVWIAERTGASLIGVDFAPGAVELAASLARRRELHERARFAVAPVTATGLPSRCADAALCVDALMFIDAYEAAREIARILRPGGRFVATAAESLVEPFMPTIVRDYRPIFEAAGFRSVYHEPIEGRDAAQLRFYRALEARSDRLRLEIGEPAEILIDEARDGIERSLSGTLRIRDMLYVAELI